MRGAIIFAVVAVAGLARAAPGEEDLKARLEALEHALVELPAAREALADLANRLVRLEDELARLRRRDGEARDREAALDQARQRIAGLEERLARAEHRLAGAPGGGLEAGYADGLTLKIGDADAPSFSLRVYGGVLARYRGVVRPAPLGNDSGVDVPRAQLGLEARLGRFFGLGLLIDAGAPFLAAGSAVVRDAFVEARPLSFLSVRAGLFKVPLSRQRLAWSFRQTFVDRALATQVLSRDRDLGGLIELAPFDGRLLLQAAATNGVVAGPALANDNHDLAYTLRVVGQPLGALPLDEGDPARRRAPRLAFGAAFQHNLEATVAPAPLADADGDGRRDNLEVWLVSVELAAKWRGLALEAEYFFRRERAGFGRPERDYHGVYGQLSAMIVAGLQLGLRGSFAQFPTQPLPTLAPLGVLLGLPREGSELGVVANYLLFASRLKAQLAYAWRRDVARDSFDLRPHEGHILEAQLQAQF